MEADKTMPLRSIIVVLLGFVMSIDDTFADTQEQRTVLHKALFVDRYKPTTKHARDTTECCPSITRGIAPLGGLARDDSLLQLFRDSNTVQKFYETTCSPGVHNSSCMFVDTTFSSRCVQQYAFTYAIVKDFNVTQPYRFDLMKIKSGCSCMVDLRIPEVEIVASEKRRIVTLTEEISVKA